MLDRIDGYYSDMQKMANDAQILEHSVRQQIYKHYDLEFIKDLSQAIETNGLEFEKENFYDVYRKYQENKLEMNDCRFLNSMFKRYNKHLKYKVDKKNRLFEFLSGGDLNE